MPALHARTRSRPRRRGVTLLEMLVAVALLVLLMTVLVSVFSAATGAVSGQRVYQELDGQLRQLDGVIRQDLTNVWAQMTPPCDPNHGGYLEYGENAFADWQGEDTDDYIRLTTKAPEGSYFTGRTYVSPGAVYGNSVTNLNASQLNAYLAAQPITVTSQFAEVIYFVRNSNLYRRVFLVAPDLQGAVNNAFAAFGQPGTYYSAQVQDPTYYAGKTSTISATNPNMVPLSWLGVNDLSAHPAPTNAAGSFTPPILNALADLTNRENRAFYQRFANCYSNLLAGPSDDNNYDGADDYVRTLYNGVFSNSNQLIFEFSPPTPNRIMTADTMAFPYIFPGAFSKVDPNGSIHGLDPSNTTPALIQSNQEPLLEGDNHVPVIGGVQTWWGFPTWRETLGANWQDPYWQVNAFQTQAPGLSLVSGVTLLPAVLTQPFNDGTGSAVFASTNGGAIATNPALWEDDLIMTNVRSFDIKAYDDTVPGYVDLGWGDDPKTHWIAGDTGGGGQYLSQTPGTTTYFGSTHYTVVDNPLAFKKLTPPTQQTFAHEGRIPPLINDGRLDAQFGAGSYSGFNYTGNVGDNQSGVVRLRRVWDSWSTAYTEAPQKAFDATGANIGFPIGPPFSPPVYPSFPPPYPAPLRGVQIQVRVVDPRNERIKVLTIRQDFSDKL